MARTVPSAPIVSRTLFVGLPLLGLLCSSTIEIEPRQNEPRRDNRKSGRCK